MENGSINGGFEFPESEFWVNYSALKDRVNSLKRKNIPLEKYDPTGICRDIENILNHDEEENLTFLQNKIRKLNAGSELCREVCVLHRHFSSLEIHGAVSGALEEAKHEKISSRILSRRALEAKREKFFLKQALDTIRISIGNEKDEAEEEEENAEPAPVPVVEKDTQPGLDDTITRRRITDIIPNLDLTQPETARAMAENPIVTNEDLRMSRTSVATRRMTEIPKPLQDVSIPEIDNQLSVHGSDLTIAVSEIEQILNSQIPESPQDTTGEPEVPEPTGKPSPIELRHDPQIPPITEDTTPDLESLPPVVTPPKKPRRFKPGFDQSTIIQNYVERAKRLNESIVIERVQVYEGPPSIIQAFTIRHLLETPATNKGFLKAVRSSVLEQLYKRHQKTQKMPHTNVDVSVIREKTVEEDVRQQPLLEALKTNLFDISMIQPNLAEVRESVNQHIATEQLERLVGTPVSKILQRDVPPLPVPIGSSDPWLPPRSPRVQNLQGTRLEPPIAEPWFKPIDQPAPDEKWREFKYVRCRLEEVWMENYPEKRASLREILHREEEWNKENMLTLLRVLDKMSLKREIVIKGYGENIVIYPFEIPYVTEKQFSLLNGLPKY